MLLGRLANHLGPDTVAKRCLPIRTNWIAKFFVTMDVVTFCIQGGGGGLQTSADPDQANLGHKASIPSLFDPMSRRLLMNSSNFYRLHWLVSFYKLLPSALFLLSWSTSALECKHTPVSL